MTQKKRPSTEYGPLGLTRQDILLIAALIVVLALGLLLGRWLMTRRTPSEPATVAGVPTPTSVVAKVVTPTISLTQPTVATTALPDTSVESEVTAGPIPTRTSTPTSAPPTPTPFASPTPTSAPTPTPTVTEVMPTPSPSATTTGTWTPTDTPNPTPTATPSPVLPSATWTPPPTPQPIVTHTPTSIPSLTYTSTSAPSLSGPVTPGAVPAPKLMEYDQVYFIWEWEGEDAVSQETWYFDIKFYDNIFSKQSYGSLTPKPANTQHVDGRWKFHFEGTIDFRCGSFWTVQIAKGNPDEDSFEGFLSDESDRLPTNQGCD